METLLFRGATVVDGSGGDPCRADVAVSGGRITAVAPGLPSSGGAVVDAEGLILAPGFIDIHGHSDMTLFRHPGAESKLFQGVTTEVVGNCGLAPFPVADGRERELADYLGLHGYILPGGGLPWRDVASWADLADRTAPGLQLAPLAGHGPLRIAAMGMADRPASAAELGRMRELLDLALRQGAWGLSTGLIYPPGCYAHGEELTELARTVAGHGGLYASHIRNEGDGLADALDEAIAVGRESGARVQVSHLKALGKKNHGRSLEALARLAEARSRGIDIAADQYPYDASATTLTAVIPAWAHDGGVAALLNRLREPSLRAGLEGEIDREISAREGAGRILVAECSSRRNRELSGRTVAEIAAGWGCPPAGAVIRLLLEEEGNVGAVFFSMAAGDVAAILADPLTAVGSDGHGLGGADQGATHPRSYGTFPRVLGRYVREEKLLPLAAAIRKMTAIPAARIGFADRGVVRPGFAADLVLFDPVRIGDCATYADPHRYASGVVHLLTGGEWTIRDGKLTGIRNGRVLRKPGTPEGKGTYGN